MNFLHTFAPHPIAFSLGPINIYWYGLIVVIGIVAGLILSGRLAKGSNIDEEAIYDLAFYLIIFGLVGARIYDCFLEAPYYLAHPGDIVKIWRGGLAIHGAIIAGAGTIYFYARKFKLDIVKLASVLVPGLALGQAIGRWGNYFNQELFGQPTGLPWGIYINFMNRPGNWANNQYFHPTFLYESLGCLLLSLVLIYLHKKLKTENKHLLIASTYFISYSIIRFSLEFIRIDYAPEFLGLRWPQFMSLGIILATAIYLWNIRKTLAKN